ncbi:hypothetical protein HC928_00275 [bacterium]|nr:hypothetical protein [bacterium]
MQPTFNAPVGRENGNHVFRRYPNGNIDIEDAKNTVVDIIVKVKDGLQITDLEKTILGCMFPLMFPFVDTRLQEPFMRVQLRLAPWEMALICDKVTAHLAEVMNYNAGLGGGSVPGRSSSRS